MKLCESKIEKSPLKELIENTEYHSFQANGIEFCVPKCYEFLKVIGEGSYGIVISVLNTETGENVAIKKIPNVFLNLTIAKRIIRELKILQILDNENIIGLFDVFSPDINKDFKDIYIVTELLDTDLEKAILSDQEFTDKYIQYFIYQIIRGVFYLHSGNIIHRDLKPSNLLVTQKCDIKICDFGMARSLQEKSKLTEYVVTRWYRAPEILLSSKEYGKPVDIWSIGCIFAELLCRKPFFPGKDYVDQFKRILEVIGTPSKEDILEISGEEGLHFIEKLPLYPAPIWGKIFPKANQKGIDLLSKMLIFNPSKRIPIFECINHPYFEGLHDSTYQAICKSNYDGRWESKLNTKEELQQIFREIRISLMS